jgi:hypothetical protein
MPAAFLIAILLACRSRLAVKRCGIRAIGRVVASFHCWASKGLFGQTRLRLTIFLPHPAAPTPIFGIWFHKREKGTPGDGVSSPRAQNPQNVREQNSPRICSGNIIRNGPAILPQSDEDQGSVGDPAPSAIATAPTAHSCVDFAIDAFPTDAAPVIPGIA